MEEKREKMNINPSGLLWEKQEKLVHLLIHPRFMW